jgi:catechol 2,3-dioxygenase
MSPFQAIQPAPQPLPPQSGLGTVCLYVADLPAQVDFYSRVIGMAVLRRDAQGASLGAGGHELLRLIIKPKGKVYEGGTGLYHFCVAVPQRLELGRLLRRVLDSGLPLQGLVDHHVAEAIYLPDAEGNGVELNWDRPRGRWPESMTAMMRQVNGPLDSQGLLDLVQVQGAGEGLLPADARIGHVHLHVSDLAAAKGFYHKVLGLDVTGEFKGQAVFTSAGGYHHHVAFNIWNGKAAAQPGQDALGLAWFELRVPAQAVADICRRFEAAGLPGLKVEGAFQWQDPDGICLRVAGQ